MRLCASLRSRCKRLGLRSNCGRLVLGAWNKRHKNRMLRKALHRRDVCIKPSVEGKLCPSRHTQFSPRFGLLKVININESLSFSRIGKIKSYSSQSQGCHCSTVDGFEEKIKGFTENFRTILMHPALPLNKEHS